MLPIGLVVMPELAGSTAPYIDPSGQVWAPDYGYLNGSAYTGAAGIDPFIQTERVNSGTLEYKFTVPNATYAVNLVFGEIAGAQLHDRRFNIVINGQACLSDVDVFELSSNHQNWVFRPNPCAATVTNGQIDIQLVPIAGSPMIGAIEILQTAGAVEDVCQRTNFYFGYNLIDQNYTVNALNRPTVSQCGGPGCPTPYQFTEMYSYTSGGLATKKRLVTASSSQSFQLETAQTYDNEGKALTVKFPDTTGVNGAPLTGSTYNYTYDNLARPVKLVEDFLSGGQIAHRTWVDNVLYGPSNELTQIGYSQSSTETRTYNARVQLTRIQGSMDVEYRYSATQNNGQITQQKNWGTGEEVTYQYDSLSRLIAAATTDASWGQAFTYDGFGNRTGATVTKGTAPSSSTVFMRSPTGRLIPRTMPTGTWYRGPTSPA